MYSDLSPDELLDMYLDGELPESEYASFFSQLSVNEKLQKELTTALVLRNTISKDTHVPPSSIEDELIGKLIPVSQRTHSSASFLTRTLSAVLLSAILSATATGSIAWLMWNTAVSKVDSAKLVSKNNTTLPHHGITNALNENSRVSVSDKPDKHQTSVLSGLISMPLHKATSYVVQSQIEQGQSIEQMPLTIQNESLRLDNNKSERSVSASDFNNTIHLTEEVEDVATDNSESTTKEIERNSSIHGSSANSENMLVTANTPFISSEQKILTDRNITTEFRFFSMRSYPNVNLPGLISPPINNFAITTLYSVDKEHAIGIEVGQENIYQKYRINSIEKEINIEQNYLAWWISGAYRYTPQWARFSEVSPFAHISIGGTQIGPTGRFVLGANIAILSPFSLMVGTEGMTILARLNGENIISSKIGITSGIAIRL